MGIRCVVGAVYGNLPEKLSGASMYFLSFFLSNFTGYTFFT